MDTLKAIAGSPWSQVLAGVLVLFFLGRWISVRYARKISQRLQAVIDSRPAPTPPTPVIPHPPSSSLVAATRQDILTDIARLSPSERISTLVNQLADALIDLRGEATYRVIFQSQIAFLQLLAVGPKTRSEAEEIHKRLLAERPSQENVPFNDWVRYLVTDQLVLLTTDGFAITVGGTEFLVWKLRRSIPDKE